jgi:branched-chain amino acid transport system permease protein
MLRTLGFWVFIIAAAAGGLYAAQQVDNEFYFFSAYVVLQFVVMATAWNILGGFTGYVNFGSAAFFALGAYSGIFLIKALAAPLWLQIIGGGVVAGLVGLGMGYLTLRLRGVFFAIATLALAVVLETLIINWDYLGGATGVFIIPPTEVPVLADVFGNYIEFLCMVMLLLALGSLIVARYLNTSKIGRGLAAIRDDEIAAGCAGVPTLKLKLLSTTISGALMGIAGAPYAYYVTFVDPASAFSLFVAVNSIAMPMIGGTTSWIGPLVGALLLGGVQQWTTVTISSELNLLVVGVMLVVFVIIAPQGIVGLVKKLFGRKTQR